MAAKMVGSVVMEETLKQVFSGVIARQQQAKRPDEREQHMERLEMAQIRLEAALETSQRWRIQDASLLRWRGKLKRAAQECEDTLRKCKQRAVEDEAREPEAISSSLPRRLAHATKSLVAALFSRDRDEGGRASTAAAVRRFEWFANGASEFLRFVELGGTPRQYMLVDPLIGRLLAGRELRYRFVRRSQYHLFCVRPISLDGRGAEAKLLFVYEDDEAPENNLCLTSMLRLSESTDIIGTIIRCLELFSSPHFRTTAECARNELAQLPTQNFSWVPYVESGHKEHWNSIHSIHSSLTQWFRPNPTCCTEQHHLKQPSTSSSSTTRRMKLSNVSDLEPVIEVSLQRHVPLSEYDTLHRSKVVGEGGSTCHTLKLGLLFSPHGSSEDDVQPVPAVECSAIEVMDGEEQGAMHTNMNLEQLDEFMLPKAIDYLHRKPKATAYQLFWKSRHGTAFLQVEKTKRMPPKQSRGVRRSAIRQRRDPNLERWIQVVKDFLNLWVAHAPRRLQGSIAEWIQKANEIQLAHPMN